MHITMLYHTQTLNGDHMGAIGTHDGPMLFALGVNTLWLGGDIGQQWYYNNQQYNETPQSILAAIWAIIQNPTTKQTDTFV